MTIKLINLSRIAHVRLLYTSNANRNSLGYQEKPDVTKITSDCIGPPNQLSNIRPILRHIPAIETTLQRKLREKQQETEKWLMQYWSQHNESFTREKADFIAKNKKPGEDLIHADKLSEFYKHFLDRNWQNHFYFNISWYLKNFELLFLALQVNVEKGIRKITKNN